MTRSRTRTGRLCTFADVCTTGSSELANGYMCVCIRLHLMRASLRVSHEVNSHLNFFIPWIPFHSIASLSLSLSPLPVLAEECANISSPALLAITSSLQRPQADIRPIAIYVSRHLKHSIRPSQVEIFNPTLVDMKSWILGAGVLESKPPVLS